MEKIQGIIHQYDDNKKFGFIKINQSNKTLFFHIRQFRANRKPMIGELVIFEIGEDNSGRICANNVQEMRFVQQKTQEKIQRQQKRRAYEERVNQKHGTLNLVCGMALFFVLLLFIVVATGQVPALVLGWYGVMSIVSFVAYLKDKNAAQNNYRRTPENTLHTYDVLGGWIGASFAQKLFNHKATKAEFRMMYYITIAVNVIGLIALTHLGVFSSFG